MKKVVALLIVVCTIMFSSCAYSEADLNAAKSEGYEDGYKVGYKDGFYDGYDEGYAAMKPITRPTSGTILDGIEYDESKITVTADSSSDYVVSLKDLYEKNYVSFYVRAGETVTVGVPSEYLYVYFACGEDWYGYGKGLMFGDDTYYSKDDEVLDFVDYSWEYTLYPVSNGNFSETPSSENEFF